MIYPLPEFKNMNHVRNSILAIMTKMIEYDGYNPFAGVQKVQKIIDDYDF